MHPLRFDHWPLSRQILVGPLLLAGVLVASVAATAFTYDRLDRSSAQVAHSQEVLRQGWELTKLVLDMETGVRGYAMTREPAFLQPYLTARDRTGDETNLLRDLVTDSPDQKARIDRVRVLVAEWEVVFAQELIERTATGADVSQVVRRGEGKRRVDEVRDLMAAFIDVEESRLDESRARDAALRRLAGGLMPAMLLIGASALALAFLASRRASAPVRDLVDAADRIAAGDLTAVVPVRGARELSRAGAAFNAMARALADESRRQVELTSRVNQLNQDLERRMVELAAANAELERASRLKSEFLANMSHELRTPLNAIIGFSELLLDGSEEEEREVRTGYLEAIRGSGQHLLALINDILDLSKVEAGKMELHPTRVDVADLVGRVLGTVEPLAARKSIALSSACDDVGAVTGDEGKLKQVLYNLLSNAIKFTPEAGRVWVEARSGPGIVQVTVADTGIGIAPEDQERIFHEFQQVDSSVTRRYEGTGLGLALSRRLIELHGGRIWVESLLGEGSRFHVVLPVGEIPAAAAVGRPDPEERPFDSESDRPLVLVVEDDPRSANLLALYLGRAGYRTEVAGDGRLALELARRLRPAAITLDIMLPGLDGWEVLRELKQHHATREIPVVVVSVTDNPQLGTALGAVDIFVKPVDRRALLAVLARLSLTTRIDERAVNVLIADDDPSAIELLASILAPAGFGVLRASGGAEAIALARAERPDLILLDLLMPVLSGFDVVEALKADPATRAIPIVVVTAKDLTEEDKQSLNGRVASILDKGAMASVDILPWLDEILRRAGTPGAAAPESTEEVVVGT